MFLFTVVSYMYTKSLSSIWFWVLPSPDENVSSLIKLVDICPSDIKFLLNYRDPVA